jgi:ubiquinone/menaquinone biosynthesis C-methylase UbiE
MSKTLKELAFLRDLAVDGEWTQRFADLVDKHLDLSEADNMLYINAGTGTHAISIYEKFGSDTAIFACCENEEIMRIAQDKAIALRADVDFSTLRFEDDAFDAVLADASLVRPAGVEDFIEDVVRVARTSGDVAVFLPTAGSFGEVVSLLWEVLFNEDLGEHGAAAEKLITDIPTVSRVEELAARAGLVNVNSETTIEVFEYENGVEFIAAPLVADFLLPLWLEMLSEEEKEQIPDKLAQLIDVEDGDITFRFSVKATLVTGEKE